MNGSNQVLKHYGLLADFSAALSHFKTLGAIVHGGYSAGGFYLDPATLERVESSIETHGAGGFYHGPATLEASFWSAIAKDSAGGFYHGPATLEGT